MLLAAPASLDALRIGAQAAQVLAVGANQVEEGLARCRDRSIAPAVGDGVRALAAERLIGRVGARRLVQHGEQLRRPAKGVGIAGIGRTPPVPRSRPSTRSRFRRALVVEAVVDLDRTGVGELAGIVAVPLAIGQAIAVVVQLHDGHDAVAVVVQTVANLRRGRCPARRSPRLPSRSPSPCIPRDRTSSRTRPRPDRSRCRGCRTARELRDRSWDRRRRNRHRTGCRPCPHRTPPAPAHRRSRCHGCRTARERRDRRSRWHRRSRRRTPLTPSRVVIAGVSQRVLAPVVGEVAEPVDPTPDQHVAAGPHRSLGAPGTRRVDRRGRDPAVGRRVVAPARVHVERGEGRSYLSTPDHHLLTRPDRAVRVATGRNPDRRRLQTRHRSPGCTARRCRNGSPCPRW